MQRGQAGAEMVALCLAVVLGICVLVRHVTAVDDIGRAVVAVLVPRREAPERRIVVHRAHHRPGGSHRGARCYCPGGDP